MPMSVSVSRSTLGSPRPANLVPWILIFILTLTCSASEKLPPKYSEWLKKDVAYIITNEERATFRGLNTDEAREKFAAQDKQKAELVKLRYFVGMTTAEAAEVLGISIPTADRHWAYTRAWLAREISAPAK